jgi:hypothetical protein
MIKTSRHHLNATLFRTISVERWRSKILRGRTSETDK